MHSHMPELWPAGSTVPDAGVDVPTPVEVGIALSLYAYNVSPKDRAERLHAHFDGACADIADLISMMMPARAAFLMTELAAPTANAYVQHALERYLTEAGVRVSAEAGLIQHLEEQRKQRTQGNEDQ